MGSLALFAYLAASRLAGVLAPTLLRKRMHRGKEDPARLGERLGLAGMERPKGQLIWLHGASVGEAMSLLPLIRALHARVDACVLLTTGTVTSANRIGDLLPMGAIHQYVPVDTSNAVRGFLDHWQPDLAIWAESELWPRLVVETSRRGIPMAMVNARLSARSHARWQKAPAMARTLLSTFDLILAQDHETVARLSDFDTDAHFVGNLKALVEMPDPDADTLERFRAAIGDRPVWLAASTHEGEEDDLLQLQCAVGPNANGLMILAPRHPERADKIAVLIRSKRLTMARRSAGEMPSAETHVYLADSLGEMALWYALASVTFVGGSFVEKGGHTPFEPIAARSVVMHGPHVDNFAPAYAALNKAHAVWLFENSYVAAEGLDRLLTDPVARARLNEAAFDVHASLKPAVDAMAAQLLELMEARP
ncbi:MAG: 3-deoxy-D-manno-octulosonic acid transferase [Paracoccaceae bacterium]